MRDQAALSRHIPLTLAIAAAAALAGCTASDDLASMTVAPGKYAIYNCVQIVQQGRQTAARERELKQLMDKAARGGGAGELAGTMAYRSEYLTARGTLRELEAAAAEKKCEKTWRSESEGVMF